MNHVYSFARYQLADSRKAVAIFYLVILILALVMVVTSTDSGGESSFSGASIVFIFILGLNCFKTSFLFAQVNNLSRRAFYFATLLSLVAVSVFMSLVDFVLERVVSSLVVYKSFYEQMYSDPNLAKVLWTVAVLTFAASLGWMITMLYYRASPPLKIIISLSPAVISWVLWSVGESICYASFWFYNGSA